MFGIRRGSQKVGKRRTAQHRDLGMKWRRVDVHSCIEFVTDHFPRCEIEWYDSKQEEFTATSDGKLVAHAWLMERSIFWWCRVKGVKVN